MHFYPRPSKCFLYDILESNLKKHQALVALDAGSNNFKNYPMFNAEYYYGLDLDFDALKKGVEKYKQDKTFGLWGDLRNLNTLPDKSIDVIASTNTLYVLNDTEREAVVKNLSRLCAPGGLFICEIPNDKTAKNILKQLEKNFEKINIIYYRNIFSRWYEKIFERRGYIGFDDLAAWLPFRFLAWLISRFEFLTCYAKKINTDIIVICQQADLGSQNKFILNNNNLIQRHIYQLTAN